MDKMPFLLVLQWRSWRLELRLTKTGAPNTET